MCVPSIACKVDIDETLVELESFEELPEDVWLLDFVLLKVDLSHIDIACELTCERLHEFGAEIIMIEDEFSETLLRPCNSLPS